MKAKRRALATAAGVAVLLGLASTAWACTSFSTISLSTPTASAGEQVVVAGVGARAHGPVEVRWNSRTGTKLAETRVAGDGTFSVPVSVPRGQAGLHVIVAIDADGDLARAPFELTPATGTARATASGAGGSTIPAGPLVVGIGALAGTLLVAGAATAAVAGRRRVPALG